MPSEEPEGHLFFAFFLSIQYHFHSPSIVTIISKLDCKIYLPSFNILLNIYYFVRLNQILHLANQRR